MPALQKLKEREPDFGVMPGAIITVRCFHCDMTMWASSDNALVDDKGRILCRGCTE